MLENQEIHGAILAIMESMRLQETSPGRLKISKTHTMYSNAICRITAFSGLMKTSVWNTCTPKPVSVLSASSVLHQMPGSTTVCGHCCFCCVICKMDNSTLRFGRRNSPLSARHVSSQNMKPSVKSWFIVDTAQQR